MTVIELTEHGPARSFVLADAAGRAVAISRLVDAAPDPYLHGQCQAPLRVPTTASLSVPMG